jgi:hypothetical protein|tara:strand:+ start:8400 stop:9098 length:699 start_codon:yes stop_codon:yes gene_type:complete
MDIRKEPPLERLLRSFQDHATFMEKHFSEFLIKFDSDDSGIPDSKFFEQFDFKVKPFVWDKHSGRSSLHEAQNVLLNYVSDTCKLLQVIADDFIFTENNFVSKMLKYQDDYVIIGQKGITHDLPPAGSGGYAPCFTKKFIDATGGFGSHCNSDGFAFGVADHLKRNYGYDPIVDFPLYYRRLDPNSTQDPNCKYIEHCHHNSHKVYSIAARNIITNLEFDKKYDTIKRSDLE